MIDHLLVGLSAMVAIVLMLMAAVAAAGAYEDWPLDAPDERLISVLIVVVLALAGLLLMRSAMIEAGL